MQRLMTNKVLVVALIGLFSSGLSAAASPTVPDSLLAMLKVVSAGHTGCLPDDNILTNVDMHYNGEGGLWGGLWNATCHTTPYLCSAVVTNRSESFSCAPVAH